ncbi:DNA-binding transcriptional regulator, XRE-family HTH domain [Geosporobacter subterraneus DSM 17957]|uniref:DNA-binding transcriptional regulator, XRE-family HTH domain n=1 Tax=Geosporobacter subterraneus DSM 17957 TaxID=1121919 RepID=A0A1M6KU23_9FIRM|nr:helix-turn-helix domain-containing protein [Geosporobacter subterraneus]SHJ62455.1 DNA-binding transcriptional regulator, XRE-family HTH domain [Geosporobacter subterraneus DSM 17957]
MKKDEIIDCLSKKIKIIRVEMDYSQDYMAEILGISKKTLIQIEKGRIKAGWTVIVALCGLFRESEIIQNLLGEDPLEVLQLISRQNHALPREKTLGGRVWWTDLENKNGFRLQKNLVSGHYRILDGDQRRWLSSFDEAFIRKRMRELTSGKEQ